MSKAIYESLRRMGLDNAQIGAISAISKEIYGVPLVEALRYGGGGALEFDDTNYGSMGGELDEEHRDDAETYDIDGDRESVRICPICNETLDDSDTVTSFSAENVDNDSELWSIIARSPNGCDGTICVHDDCLGPMRSSISYTDRAGKRVRASDTKKVYSLSATKSKTLEHLADVMGEQRAAMCAEIKQILADVVSDIMGDEDKQRFVDESRAASKNERANDWKESDAAEAKLMDEVTAEAKKNPAYNVVNDVASAVIKGIETRFGLDAKNAMGAVFSVTYTNREPVSEELRGIAGDALDNIITIGNRALEQFRLSNCELANGKYMRTDEFKEQCEEYAEAHPGTDPGVAAEEVSKFYTTEMAKIYMPDSEVDRCEERLDAVLKKVESGEIFKQHAIVVNGARGVTAAAKSAALARLMARKAAAAGERAAV